MPASTTLLQFLLMLAAGWLHRQQAAVIEYLKAENRLLRERLGGRHIIFTDAERRQLAETARAVGRKVLIELGAIVTPDAASLAPGNCWRASGFLLKDAGPV